MHNMGTLIEDTETDIRVNMDALYIQKTREVVNNIVLHKRGRRRARPSRRRSTRPSSGTRGGRVGARV